MQKQCCWISKCESKVEHNTGAVGVISVCPLTLWLAMYNCATYYELMVNQKTTTVINSAV